MGTELFHPHSTSEAQRYFDSKIAFTTGPIEVDAALKENHRIRLIDVRASKDFDEGHVPGARNLPESEWESLKGLSQDRTNVLYCYSSVCHLAARAAAKFAAEGYSVMEMDGGFEAWKDHDLDVEKSELPTEVVRPGLQAANPNRARNYDANPDTNVNSFAPRV